MPATVYNSNYAPRVTLTSIAGDYGLPRVITHYYKETCFFVAGRKDQVKVLGETNDWNGFIE